LYAVCAKELQAGGGNEIIFKEERTPIFQVARTMRRRTKQMITCLHTSDGTTLTTHLEIRNRIAGFYASAYTGMTTEEAMITQVGQWVSRRLTPEENARLTQPPNLEELKRTIEKGPRNKAPGADDIIRELYIHFWDVIKRDFLTIYNSIL
jgi:hypothetical protein